MIVGTSLSSGITLCVSFHFCLISLGLMSSGFIHAAACVKFISFLGLNSTPLCASLPFLFPHCPSVDIWVVSNLAVVNIAVNYMVYQRLILLN